MQSRPALRIADSLVLSAAICAYASTTATTHAQQFPAKPVRYGVAFAAGDSPDIVARLAGDRLTRIWDQQVLVENRVGAGGTIAGAYVAKAPADGRANPGGGGQPAGADTAYQVRQGT